MEDVLRLVPVLCAVLLALGASGCAVVSVTAALVETVSLGTSAASAAAAVVGPSAKETKTGAVDRMP